MATRIECPLEGWEDIWIDYRDDGWTFGARRRITEAQTDVELVLSIMEFVEDWNMLDIDKTPVIFDKDKGIELFDNIDDLEVYPWVVGSWYEARAKRAEVSKN